MIKDLLDRVATTIEGVSVDDTRGAQYLRHDPSLDGKDDIELKPNMFRRFAFMLDGEVSPERLHETPNQQPTFWNLTTSLVVYYPLGNRVDNTAIIHGMALDDATRIVREIPRRLEAEIAAAPITDLTLIGARIEHTGLSTQIGLAVASGYSLTIRFGREF